MGFAVNIVRNRCRRQHGERQPVTATDLDADLDDFPLEPAGEDGGELADLEAALVHLPEGYSSVIRLCVFENLSGDALAAALGCSPDAAKTRKCRAVKALKKIIKARYVGEGHD
jgi:DNA-directed RNA polymerase specialized sigma24 family protein